MCDRSHLKSLEEYTEEIRGHIKQGDLARKGVLDRTEPNIGEMLLEARGQMTAKEFQKWIERNFRMTLKQADYYMDAAYAARRNKQQGIQEAAA